MFPLNGLWCYFAFKAYSKYLVKGFNEMDIRVSGFNRGLLNRQKKQNWILSLDCGRWILFHFECFRRGLC